MLIKQLAVCTYSCVTKLLARVATYYMNCTSYNMPSLHIQGAVSIEPPQITLPYQPPDVCAVRGGDGDDGVNGGTQLVCSTMAITLLALMASLL